MNIKRALVSVSDKTGITDFGKSLHEMGVEIISTGGTARALRDAGVPVKDISEITGFPEMMDGRVKTLHPIVHGGLLALRDSEEHMAAAKKHGIGMIDMVVCNLYPFEAAIAKEGVSLEEVIENIDIGGPSMVRSAAKNHRFVIILTNPAQYGDVLGQLRETGDVPLEARQKLAIEAYTHTAHYDAIISGYLRERLTGESYPQTLNLTYEKVQGMRYGENPHQSAAFYKNAMGYGPEAAEPSVTNSRQLHGKQLSYNNIMDADCAIEAVKEFAEPTCVNIKHATPCGIASAPTLKQAWLGAYDCDTYSPFGGVIAFNRELDGETAQELAKLFLELVIAPSFSKGSLDILTQKKNLRLLEVPGLEKPAGRKGRMTRYVVGGLLVQDRDTKAISKESGDWKTATEKQPTGEQLKAMEFAVKCVKHVKSNSVVFVQGTKTVGIGGGQTARVDSSFIACHKGGERIKGSVMASDAFFPFRDAVDIAAEKGVAAIVQPGGSIRDDEVIAAANEHGIAMVFSGQRCFRH
ncbi:MAG: bifunctional phosphoribosylaminoimidazolecarboxamide formyltransferase/inosine monophosphate cyclohydrolase [Thermoplasmata archaeon HGW-Thermoplasmata-1]|nr:MAG: bifunctional phosphoribosylaminoimidazolecarboxamide formyltransferase/inosine monophosphate cyclohydrolase [Thermoplasmata archaeon HGW-Thermoplasmata-1]